MSALEAWTTAIGTATRAVELEPDHRCGRSGLLYFLLGVLRGTFEQIERELEAGTPASALATVRYANFALLELMVACQAKRPEPDRE